MQAAIAAGDTVTGATIFRIEPSLDSGRCTAWSPRPSDPPTPRGTCLGRLADTGAGLLETTLDGIADGALTPVPQPADGVSLAPKITVEAARVRWELPAHVVDRRIRAVTPTPARGR